MTDWRAFFIDLGSIVIPLANFLMLFLLYTKSRSWTGPGLAVRIETVESDLQIVRGNVTRIDRVLAVFHRQSLESNHEVLKELSSIREMFSEKASLHAKVEEINDEIEDVRETIKLLSCYQKLKEER